MEEGCLLAYSYSQVQLIFYNFGLPAREMVRTTTNQAEKNSYSLWVFLSADSRLWLYEVDN